jgi:hypothetical protein
MFNNDNNRNSNKRKAPFFTEYKIMRFVGEITIAFGSLIWLFASTTFNFKSPRGLIFLAVFYIAMKYLKNGGDKLIETAKIS